MEPLDADHRSSRGGYVLKPGEARRSIGPFRVLVDGADQGQDLAVYTGSLPRGGMRFTLEHRNAGEDFVFGLLGGVSCCDSPAKRDHNRIAKLLPQ